MSQSGPFFNTKSPHQLYLQSTFPGNGYSQWDQFYSYLQALQIGQFLLPKSQKLLVSILADCYDSSAKAQSFFIFEPNSDLLWSLTNSHHFLFSTHTSLPDFCLFTLLVVFLLISLILMISSVINLIKPVHLPPSRKSTVIRSKIHSLLKSIFQLFLSFISASLYMASIYVLYYNYRYSIKQLQYFSKIKLGIQMSVWLVGWIFLFRFGALFLQCIKFQEIILSILPILPYYYFLLLSGYFSIGLLLHETAGVAHNPINASLLFFQQSRLDLANRDVYSSNGGYLPVVLGYIILSVILLNLPLAFIMEAHRLFHNIEQEVLENRENRKKSKILKRWLCMHFRRKEEKKKKKHVINGSLKSLVQSRGNQK